MTWDWTQVFRTIGEHSTYLANEGFVPFSITLLLIETKEASSGIWNSITVFISSDDNRYVCVCVCVCVF